MKGLSSEMKQQWTKEELIEHFTLLPSERKLVENKNFETQLGFAVLFKYFQHEARFPTDADNVPFAVVEFIAEQLRINTDQFYQYPWKGVTIKRHRSEIRKFFGFREHTADDLQAISQWLMDKVLSHIHDIDVLKERAYTELRQRKIEPPAISANAPARRSRSKSIGRNCPARCLTGSTCIWKSLGCR
jgi:Domain of unknown function (DUF4158)